MDGRSVPFFKRTDPTGVAHILASEAGQRKIGAVFAASLVKAVVPGQILGRVAATGLLIPVKSGVVKTAIADTTASTSIVLSGNPGLVIGDVVSVALDGGAVTKTLTNVVYSSGNNDTTLTFTALGAGALSVGARVNTTAATGGTGVAIAAQYVAGGADAVDYTQNTEVYLAGCFLKSALIDYDAHILADLSGKEDGQPIPSRFHGQSNDTIVTIF
jgi:hypothetical protein